MLASKSGYLAVSMLIGILALTSYGCARSDRPKEEFDGRLQFERITIDSGGSRDPWGKGVGDIDGDGRPDLLVGGNASGGLAWYQNPSWKKRSIAKHGAFGTDIEVADIDGDGKNDVVAVMRNALVWFRNSDWKMSLVDEVKLHDVEVSDIDGDGSIDIIARGQSAFGGGGNVVLVYLQRGAGSWERQELSVADGEGLKVVDVNGDGQPDIVINGSWYQNVKGRVSSWPMHRYASKWTWPHTFIGVGDINGDGRTDIVLSPAEREGERYRISWFEAPTDRSAEWPEHIVAPDVEAVVHFVGVADMDMDGKADIVSAAMYQGRDPDEVRIYLNQGGGKAWKKQVISESGSHSMRLVDIDGDGDMDLFGANWSGPYQDIELFINNTCSVQSNSTQWQRWVIDQKRPWGAVFVDAGDLDGDGRIDIVSGGWWYRNPGGLNCRWIRKAIGSGVNNLAMLLDVDGDGHLDVLATRGKGADENSKFVWAHNNGHGQFRVYDNIPMADGDFLQGVARGRFGTSTHQHVALSWHKRDKGVQLLTIPAMPTHEPWAWARISTVSQDEALSAGDIDRDGQLDLLLGTIWLKNSGAEWIINRIDGESGNPDRNRLADINRDGRLDAIVGFEAISKLGDVVWYEQPQDLNRPWIRHLIATVIGPMSLDVGDVDGDGDLDVVVGEHNLKAPETARLLLFENLDGLGQRWREHVIHVGDEHHDGAVFVDIDGDGDLDVISIGWEHDRVLLYENRVQASKSLGKAGLTR